ncbi:sortase B protein-sorting domain-containing protein [Pontibacillus litoralis]
MNYFNTYETRFVFEQVASNNNNSDTNTDGTPITTDKNNSNDNALNFNRDADQQKGASDDKKDHSSTPNNTVDNVKTADTSNIGWYIVLMMGSLLIIGRKHFTTSAQ